MSGCAVVLSEFLFELEAGGSPQVAFFRDPDCQGPRFPFNQITQQSITEAGTTFRNMYICGENPTTKPQGNETRDPTGCVPAFQSAVVPNNVAVRFLARWDDNIPSNVTERGEFEMSVAKGSVGKTTNVWELGVLTVYTPARGGAMPRMGANTQRWHRLTGRQPSGPGALCSIDSVQTRTSCGQNDEQEVCGQARAADYKANFSIFSCGTVFWPTFTRLQVDLNATGTAATFPLGENNQYTAAPQDSDLYGVPKDKNPTIGAIVYRSSCDVVGYCNSPPCPFTDNKKITMTAYECMVLDCGSSDRPTECPGCQGSLCSCSSQCYGNKGGSVESMHVYATQKWQDEILMACFGAPMTLGNVRVQRYGNGTRACDPLVEQLCRFSSQLDSNPAFRKKCACILEKARLERQFGGIDLPSACFLSVCNDSDQGVYKTSGESQTCSARLCVQTLSVHGAAIAAQGFQTLECNGVVYDVQNTTATTPGVVPTVTVSADALAGQGISLGQTFWVALAIMAVMVVLTIVVVIRRVVMSRRQRQARQSGRVESIRQRLGLA